MYNYFTETEYKVSRNSPSMIQANFTRICMESNKQNVAYIMPTSLYQLNFSKWTVIILFLLLSTLDTGYIFTICSGMTQCVPQVDRSSAEAQSHKLWCQSDTIYHPR